MKIKSVILTFCIMGLLPAIANAKIDTKTYRDDIAKCDAAGDAAITMENSTGGINNAIMGASNCYIKIGNSVIKKYYKSTAEETAKKFIAFANSAYAATVNVYMGPDLCYPECGNIAENMRVAATESYIKQYIIDMLDYLDTLDI